MQFELFLVFIAAQFITQISADDEISTDESCLELFKTFEKPRNCCNHPKRHILPSHQKKCKKTCDKIGDKTGGCCAIDCNYHTTKVIVDKKFNKNALLELYENDLNERGAGKFDQWLPIVETSIETCQKMIPESNDIFVCNVSQLVLDIMDCVDQENFKNCPTYTNSTECRKLKSFIESSGKCGKKINGNFIIDYRIFETKEE